MRTGRIVALDELVAERGTALRATARLLAGSAHAGDDLLQATLERCVRSWRRVDTDAEAYVRRVLYRQALDGWSARRARPERLGPVDPPPVADHADATVLRQALLAALAQLPPRQRACVVLRYFEDRTEADTAQLLGCSVGTVKSTTSKAVARLRTLTDLHHLEGVDR